MRPKVVLADASWHAEYPEQTVLACVLPDGTPASKMLPCKTNNIAEAEALGLALRTALKQRCAMTNKRWQDLPVLFISDNVIVVQQVLRPEPSPQVAIQYAKQALSKNPLWQLIWSPRSVVSPAHKLAEQHYQAWLLGYSQS